MTDFAITPPATTSLAIQGSSERFPVRRVYCVGRNYAAHAREMGANPDREPPFFFSKPRDAVDFNGKNVPYPPQTNDLHHEIELVVALSGKGTNISSEQALSLVYGYAVGLDLTRRDLQQAAKLAGKPWDMGKGFDFSAPTGPLHKASEIGHPDKGTISLEVNGLLRQQGDLADMIWSVPETIAYLSTLVTLMPGDLIFTGTPEGVGPLVRGDKLVGKITGFSDLSLSIS